MTASAASLIAPRTSVALQVNGEVHDLAVAAGETLLTVLRDRLRLTGAKCGCNQGVCGACTVLCDGEPVRACLTLAISLSGRRIVTIENADGEEPVLGVVRRAFVDAGAIQCGFCMTGMIIAATALLRDRPRPEVEEIRQAISGNLCRCSGYVKVIDAVRLAGDRLAAERLATERREGR